MNTPHLANSLSRAEAHLTAGRHVAARREYEAIAAKFPQCTEAHFQLAVILHDQNDLDGAVRHLRKLLELQPDLAEVHYNLGTLLSRLGRRDDALAALAKCIALRPEMAEAHNNLGILLRDQGELDRASESFQQAVTLQPDFVAALVNLGTTLTRCRRGAQATEFCRRACELQPELADAHLAYGLALEQADQPELSVRHLEEAVRLKPEKVEWRFHLAASKGIAPPPIAPAEYVASLFDAYAAKFDEHLRGRLRYQTPELILSAVRSCSAERRSDVLDLGCGTGLCGELFRPLADRLTGIDLSAEMIHAAEKRGCYDELRVQSIAECLTGSMDAFDLILSSDVFIYIGDLSESFSLVATALRTGGLIAYSVEAAEEVPGAVHPTAGYRLSSTRRYVHSLNYLRELALRSGLVERSVALKDLRYQAGSAVKGWIVVLEKPRA